jgi:flavin reductase (DIM6/NTAB) family NADH-FMN oxidoreductase RutF
MASEAPDKVQSDAKSEEDPIPDPKWQFGDGGHQKPSDDIVTIIPDSLPEGKTIYALAISAVTPRPVAFVSSVSKEGQTNLAPFSFFNVMCHNPPTVAFCCVHRGGKPKDTMANVRATGECVVNIISEDFVEAANACSGEYPPEVDEFEISGLTKVPSTSLPESKPPRVGEAKVQMECRVSQFVDLTGRNGKPSATMVICKIEAVHLHASVHRKTANGSDYVDVAALRPMSRLGGTNWGRTSGTFSIPRPAADAWKQLGNKKVALPVSCAALRLNAPCKHAHTVLMYPHHRLRTPGMMFSGIGMIYVCICTMCR